MEEEAAGGCPVISRWQPGQGVFDRLRLLLDCQELLGEVLDSIAKKAGLGDGGVEKVNLVEKVSSTIS